MTDLEQALQDAAADVLGTGEVSTLEDGNDGIDRAVEMMLAHPSMQAIAREAASWRAVGRLIEEAPKRHADRVSVEWFAPKAWWDGHIVPDALRWTVESDTVKLAGSGPTLDAAIAAALGDDDE